MSFSSLKAGLTALFTIIVLYGSIKYFKDDIQSLVDNNHAEILLQQRYSDNLDKIADQINSDPSSTWKAKKYNRWHFKTEQDVIKLNGARLPPLGFQIQEKKKFSIEVKDLPVNFDPRDKWPKCEALKEVRDQGDCGACWAVAAGHVMSTRLCIHSKDFADQRRVSSEDLQECCGYCGNGCNGGFNGYAWQYFNQIGIVTGNSHKEQNLCKPFGFPRCKHYSHDSSNIFFVMKFIR